MPANIPRIPRDPNGNTLLCVRMTYGELDTLDAVAKLRGQNRSDFVRTVMLSAIRIFTPQQPQPTQETTTHDSPTGNNEPV